MPMYESIMHPNPNLNPNIYMHDLIGQSTMSGQGRAQGIMHAQSLHPNPNPNPNVSMHDLNGQSMMFGQGQSQGMMHAPSVGGVHDHNMMYGPNPYGYGRFEHPHGGQGYSQSGIQGTYLIGSQMYVNPETRHNPPSNLSHV